jgi:hypothetical protein
MLVQRLTGGLRTSEQNTIPLATAIYSEPATRKTWVIAIPETWPAVTSWIWPG